ncbi:MAG: hypothetical protein ABIR55_14680, partial [Burkholderiaceae bacterium]
MLTLSNGISTLRREPPDRFTNVNDATQDHAEGRAKRTNAASVFQGTAFHLATTRGPAHGASFFGTICGGGPIKALKALLPHTFGSAHPNSNLLRNIRRQNANGEYPMMTTTVIKCASRVLQQARLLMALAILVAFTGVATSAAAADL